MSLADRFGGGLPRAFAPGMQALERLLKELGTAGTQAGTTLEGLDLSWAEPDLSLGGLTLPLTAAEAEAEAAAGAAGEARRTVRPAARAGAPGGGPVSHGTSSAGAAALAGKVPAGAVSQGLGLLGALAGEYQAATGKVPVEARPGGAAAPKPAEAHMRPASATERERWVPGHGHEAGPGTRRAGVAGQPAPGTRAAGPSPSAEDVIPHNVLGLSSALTGFGPKVAGLDSELEIIRHPLESLGAVAPSHSDFGYGTPGLTPRVPRSSPSPEPTQARTGPRPDEPWPRAEGASPLPPDWAGDWRPLYAATDEETDLSAGAPGPAPATPRSSRSLSPAEAPDFSPTVAEGYLAGAGAFPLAAGMAPSPGLTPASAAVPAPDLESVLGSALASAVPGLSASPLANWAPAGSTAPAGDDGPRQQVHLSMQVQLQGGQAAAAPGSDDLARRIKEILIAEARRHGIDL